MDVATSGLGELGDEPVLLVRASKPKNPVTIGVMMSCGSTLPVKARNVPDAMNMQNRMRTYVSRMGFFR